MTTMATRGHGDTGTRGNTLKFSPRHILPIVLLIAGAISVVHGISDKAGTKNGAFLKIATDARGVALGPAIVSMAEGSEGLRWNPAVLARTDTQEFSATHIQYYQSVAIEQVSYAYPLEDSAFAASVFYLSPGSLEGRDVFSNPTGDFSFYDLVGSVGYGRRLRSREEGGIDLYLGADVKVVQEQIADTQNQNPALDVGLLAIPLENLRIGFSARNISSGKANFVKEYTGGVSYTMFKVFTPAIALRYTDDAPPRISIAGEYRFPELQNSVARVGYQSHDPLSNSLDSDISFLRSASIAGLTLGTGLEIRPPMFKTLNFGLDYAMAPFGALGISHTLTVKLKW